VDANIKALNYPKSDYFNISTIVETSNKDLYYMLKQVTNYPNDPLYGPARPGDVQRSSLDNTKAKEHLTWTPQTALSEGINKTVQYYKNLPNV
jgi:UDP-glucose 4-epimerase